MADRQAIARAAKRVFSGLEPAYFYKITFSYAGNVTTATYYLDVPQQPDRIVAVIEKEGEDYVEYTVDGTGVTKGDLVFVSANDTVSTFSTITNA